MFTGQLNYTHRHPVVLTSVLSDEHLFYFLRVSATTVCGLLLCSSLNHMLAGGNSYIREEMPSARCTGSDNKFIKILCTSYTVHHHTSLLERAKYAGSAAKADSTGMLWAHASQHTARTRAKKR